MRYSAYQDYKDSNVQWLERIPSHWDTFAVWMGFELGRGRVISNEEIQDNSGVYPVYSSQTENNGEFGKIDSYDFDGDYMTWTTDGANAGTVFERHGKFNCTNVCGTLKPRSNDFHLTFYRHALDVASGWFVRHDINPKLMNNVMSAIRIPKLPYEEQKQIAAFIDRETAVIDTLIAKQEELIRLLGEKRTAVISHAVTKGLNPHAPLKDSGIEWLGQIPAHWEVKRLKYLGKALIGLTYSPNDVVDEGEGTLVLRASNVQDGKIALQDNVYVNTEIPEKLRTLVDDILICSRSGSRNLIGKNALIDDKSEGVTFGAFMTVFRSPNNQYLSWVLNSSLFEYQSSSFLTSTINQLTLGNLYSFEIPIPPQNEQSEINSYLTKKTKSFDCLIDKSSFAIELLKERRTALISAAVTGKIDVRQP